MQTNALSDNTSCTPQRIHPALWRASQLARMPGRCVDTGFPPLSAQLPGGGWPLGNLTELLTQQSGIGEIQLLCPALASLASRSIFLVQPPHTPQIAAWENKRCPAHSLFWARPLCAADALWAAEQVLRSGTFGAVLLWQKAVRGPDLRRLHLAAQKGETLFTLILPLAAANQPSAAPLRLALRPAPRGLAVSILKRRGAVHDEPIALNLYPETLLPELPHENMDRRAPAAGLPGNALSAMAH